ncbi:sodium-dependent bicarbonate transport family permease [Amylibacter sp. SFDW26]|uniref:sodium-dependent bicarbonate transport family permease n=1 Tax=Amylibacter sp. SFDW26 TaxID=2652722 RepID=UPI0012622143|nr:sodium-dependent bicarbonate transport family permease [Amylibacter sp. SFDW26]KAB7610394.1 sodium-dependent bicarbonate transport family permease [Amylibacter sp. SFDW26]
MEQLFALAQQNLLSPIILFFALGFAAAIAKSDLNFPEAIAKGMSLYLLFAIGFKGGASLSGYGIDAQLILSLLAGIVLSACLPLLAFVLLRLMTRMSTLDAAAVAAHYGSISIVTFVAASSILEIQGIAYDGYMVAVAATMEAPAIISALWLISKNSDDNRSMDSALMREIMLNGSIVLLIGSFLIGLATGKDGFAEIAPFISAPFKGVLCLFLLDMGLVAGRGLVNAKGAVSHRSVAFGVLMPLIGASIGLLFAVLIGLPLGSAVLMMVLSASASYIAVPAAMRVAVPEANPAIYLTLSLGVTFPFNLTVGIPLYVAVATAVVGG